MKTRKVECSGVWLYVVLDDSGREIGTIARSRGRGCAWNAVYGIGREGIFLPGTYPSREEAVRALATYDMTAQTK